MAQEPVSDVDEFGARLALALKASNMSRSQLAAALGVDKSVISRWLSGHVRPSDYNIARISTLVAKALPGFNMTLWTAPAAEFEMALGLSPGSAPAAAALHHELRQAEIAAAPPTPRHLGRRWLYAIAVLVLLPGAAGAWLWLKNDRPASPQATRAAEPSVAVLPFVNMSGDPAKEYLGDGIAEELLNDLSNTPHLQVASRTSSFSFKGKSADIGEIAHKLHVSAVLEGSARQEGRRIRIVAQLIDARSGYHLWSASYDRDFADILAVQDKIARAIVGALTQKLLPRQTGGAPRFRTPARINPDAYAAYLQGRYAEKRSNAEEFLRAMDCFKRAIKLQPDFADAHAGLAMTELALFMNGARRDTLDPARREVGAALRLDPQNFRALVADARAKEAAWQWAAADSALNRLLHMYPNSGELHFEYGVFLANFGLWEQSLKALRRAGELEPFQPSYRDNLGLALHFIGRNNEALAEFQQVLKLDPTFMWAVADLCSSYANMGRLSEATQILRERLVPEYSEDENTLNCAWSIAYRQHDTRELRRLARFSERLYAHKALAASWLAYPYALLGDYENAVRWLEKAYDDRDANLFYAVADPDLPGQLKKTSHWQKFIRRPALQDVARMRAHILARGG